MAKLSLEDFVGDSPWQERAAPSAPDAPRLIEGVSLTPLHFNSDARGSLVELMTTRDGPIEPIVHVYKVCAEPGSVRAWVYHKLQSDRLHFTEGSFKVVLYDLRPDSPTYEVVNEFDLGAERPTRIVIPPYVVHGVKNVGSAQAAFINMPTRAFDLANPDKFRLPLGHKGVPYAFE